MNIYHYKNNFREGLILHKNGQWAEVAPLPGWSRETLSEALDQLRCPRGPLYPSVAFALEMLEAPPLQKPVSISVSAFFMGTPAQILARAEKAEKNGFTTAKVKIGHLGPEEAFEVVSALKDKFRLRIDINRKWDLKRALDFFSAFAPDAFDYIEEPVQNPEDLVHFTHPIALDEFFHLDFPGAKALVYKPTLRGGPSSFPKTALPCIVGGAFESGIGIYQIARLVPLLGLPDLPIGIDTYSYLEEDLLETPLLFSGGKVHLPLTIHPNMDLLHAL